MKVIGITGGVGSGKSTITSILEAYYNAFIINTDQIAHLLMGKDMISYKLIVKHFGDTVLDSNGEINRILLGNMVYQDRDKLILLNSLTHPYVMEFVNELIKTKREEKIELVCVETALPNEAGLKSFCDEIWYVFAPEEIRRDRLQKERNYSEEKINSIFSKQLSDQEYRELSTHSLSNHCTRKEIIEQIEVLLEK